MKLTNDVKSEIFKNLSLFSIGPVIGSIISFITVPITTWLVVPEQFGKATMFTVIQGIFTILLCFGYDQALVREYYGAEDKKKLLANVLLVPLLLVVISGLAVFLFHDELSRTLFGENSFIVIICLILNNLFMVLIRFNEILLRVTERPLLYSVLGILNKVLTLVTLLGFLLLWKKNFESIVVATTAATFVSSVLFVLSNSRFWKGVKLVFDKQMQKTLLDFSYPILISSGIFWLMSSFDRLSLRKWSTFTDIGIYTGAFKIVSVLSIVQNAFTTYWGPTAIKWYEQNVERSRFNLVNNMVSSITVLMFFFITILRAPIVNILSSAYSDSLKLIPFLLFVPSMYLMSETTVVGITFSRKTYYNIVNSVIALACNICLNFILVPKYGAKGAAIAMMFSYIVFFLSRSFFSRRLWFKFDLFVIMANTIVMIALAAETLFWSNVGIELLFLIPLGLINGKNYFYLIQNLFSILSKKRTVEQ